MHYDFVIRTAEGDDVVIPGVSDEKLRESVEETVDRATRTAHQTADRLRGARPKPARAAHSKTVRRRTA